MKEVWAQSRQCGLDNRQATLQIAVFADGVDRVRPTVIFPGKGLRISAKEKQTVMTINCRSCIKKRLGVTKRL